MDGWFSPDSHVTQQRKNDILCDTSKKPPYCPPEIDRQRLVRLASPSSTRRSQINESAEQSYSTIVTLQLQVQVVLYVLVSARMTGRFLLHLRPHQASSISPPSPSDRLRRRQEKQMYRTYNTCFLPLFVSILDLPVRKSAARRRRRRHHFLSSLSSLGSVVRNVHQKSIAKKGVPMLL